MKGILEHSQKEDWAKSRRLCLCPSKRGKPIKLLRVSQPQIGSSSASASTLKKRSQVIEKLAENLSSPSTSSSTTENDVIHQTAICICRKPTTVYQFIEGRWTKHHTIIHFEAGKTYTLSD